MHPAQPLGVVQVHQFIEGPVDVSAQKSYLPVDPCEGIAYDPPNNSTSTSCDLSQCGHKVVIVRGVKPFTRLYRSCK
jgi:hypothetical protein